MSDQVGRLKLQKKGTQNREKELTNLRDALSDEETITG